MEDETTVVCGVDPGLGTTGYAVLRVEAGRSITLVDAGACRTDASMSLARRLRQLETDFVSVLEEHRPHVVAVENLYAHYNHPRTAILMGHARGVLLCGAARLDMDVKNYGATRVKRYLTGNGHASKEQVQQAVRLSLGLSQTPHPPDVADALAIALCCAGEMRSKVF